MHHTSNRPNLNCHRIGGQLRKGQTVQVRWVLPALVGRNFSPPYIHEYLYISTSAEHIPWVQHLPCSRIPLI